jgi:hypothetical protein
MTAEQRRNPRKNIRIKAAIVDAAGAVVGECVVSNISDSGAKLTRITSMPLPDKFELILARGGIVRRHCTVAWRSESGIGVRFAPTKSVSDV